MEIRVASAITLVKAVTELYLGSRDRNTDIPAGRPGSVSIMLYDHMDGILVCERYICPGRQHVYEGPKEVRGNQMQIVLPRKGHSRQREPARVGGNYLACSRTSKKANGVERSE